MKKKYLAYCLALSMALTAAAPVAAAEPVDIVVEDDSEDTVADFAEDNEEAEVTEEDTEEAEDAVDEAVTSDVGTEAADFGDGKEATPVVGEGETQDATWTEVTGKNVKYRYEDNVLYVELVDKAVSTEIPDFVDAWAMNEAANAASVTKIVIGEGITSIGQKCFKKIRYQNMYAQLKEVVLPSTLTTIKDYAFASQNTLEKIDFKNVTSIGTGAFESAGLKEINLSAEEVTLGSSAFTQNQNLTSVKAHKLILSTNAFSSCTSLTEVKVDNPLESIPERAFASTALSNFDFSKVKEVGESAFRNGKLEKIDFGEAEVTIGQRAFARNKKLTSVNGHKITLAGTEAFDGCSGLAEFQLDTPLETIPDYTFEEIAMTTFDFSKAKEIGASAFAGAKLAKIEYGETDLTIADSAFDQCTDLTAICYPGSEEKWKEISASAKIPETTAVHCKADTVEAKSATCTETGLKEVGVCEVCGMHYSYQTDENVLPALGHDYEAEFTVDKAATCTEPGVQSKHCTRCDSKTEEQAIPAVGHKWSTWKKTADATVNAAEKQARKCNTCGKAETRTVGKKLTPKATVNAATVTLKVKQSTAGLKVTGLAKGDYVKSWKSTNAKVFTVSGKSNGTCKITGKKKGTAKLEITLASGLKKTVKVKVQTTAVKTTKISGLKKSVALKKGKRTTLKPVIAPFTSREKVTYTSSNKKVATVSSKGVVTAKKKGTTKITVRSGKKSYTVKVTVK